jgi:hypothetical protein
VNGQKELGLLRAETLIAAASFCAVKFHTSSREEPIDWTLFRELVCFIRRLRFRNGKGRESERERELNREKENVPERNTFYSEQFGVARVSCSLS